MAKQIKNWRQELDRILKNTKFSSKTKALANYFHSGDAAFIVHGMWVEEIVIFLK